MKIAIDGRWIFKDISGIGAYTRELLRHLPAVDSENEYQVLFCEQGLLERTVSETELNAASNFLPRLVKYGVFSAANQLALPRLLRREGVDVFHSANYMIPYLAFPRGRPGRTRCVVTIHDLIPMLFRHYAPRSLKNRFFPLYRWLMHQTAARSDASITVSNASRRDLLNELHIPGAAEGKVRTVHNGVSTRHCPAQDPGAPRDGNAGRTRTILYVGRADPYKNLGTLIRAVAGIRSHCPFPLRLAVVGSPDPRYPEAPRLASQLAVEDVMDWMGYVTDSELVEAYRSADVLAQPSRYEGFGLQVLEAMACGLPVVCSNAASLPEVAGDAALTVAPDDHEALGARIREVLENSDVSRGMIERGLHQAARFTWQRCAEETLAVYRDVAALQG